MATHTSERYFVPDESKLIQICAHTQCKTNTIPILMHQMRISTNQVSSVVLRPKKFEIRKMVVKTVKQPKKTKYYTMKLSQIRRRIELCMREIVLRFEMNL
jgi:hypothetical protein